MCTAIMGDKACTVKKLFPNHLTDTSASTFDWWLFDYAMVHYFESILGFGFLSW